MLFKAKKHIKNFSRLSGNR